MYRLVVYGLVLLLAVSFIFALTGDIYVSPSGLVVSTSLFCVVCYAVNRLFARLYHVPANSESWLITALILTCIMAPATTWQRALAVSVAAAIAIASKYILMRRGANLFNPAAIAALVVSLCGVLPATWWIGSPSLVPFVIVIGGIIAYKVRRLQLFTVFAAVALVVALFVGDQSVSTVVTNTLFSTPLLFLGTILLTEPSTMPTIRRHQLLYAGIVGLIFASQLHVGNVGSTPQLALVIGNIFVAFTGLGAALLLRNPIIEQHGAHGYDFVYQVPKNSGFSFLPGQYAEWTLAQQGNDSRGNRRMFSIASSPTEQELRIGIKAGINSSTYKKALLAATASTMRVSKVTGDFVLPNNTTQPLLFIAGGIGITPFRSMLKYLVDKNQKRDIVLVYLERDAKNFRYADVLHAAKSVGVTIHYKTERLTTADLQQLVSDIAGRHCFIAGSNAMVTNYKQMLARELNIPRRAISTDHFSGY